MKNWSKEDAICYGDTEGDENKEKPFNLTNRRLLETLRKVFERRLKTTLYLALRKYMRVKRRGNEFILPQ